MCMPFKFVRHDANFIFLILQKVSNFSTRQDQGTTFANFHVYDCHETFDSNCET